MQPATTPNFQDTLDQQDCHIFNNKDKTLDRLAVDGTLCHWMGAEMNKIISLEDLIACWKISYVSGHNKQARNVLQYQYIIHFQVNNQLPYD